MGWSLSQLPRLGNPLHHFMSVWGECSERGLCHCLASGGLLDTCPISSHFTHCATGALPAVTLVLNPRVGGFTYILRPCGPFKWSFLKIWQFLPSPQSPLVFTARSHENLFSQCWNPWLCSLALGLGLLTPKVSLPIFIHHT